MRTEPPPSVPSESGAMPSATAAALPPEEPPEVRARVPRVAGDPGARRVGDALPAQLRRGRLADEHAALLAHAGRPTGASTSHGPAASIECEPRSVGQPRVSSRSLIDTGTPSSAPHGSPRAQPVLGRAGRRQRRGLVDEAERVDPRVEPGDAGQHRAGGLHRRQRAGPVGGEQLDGAGGRRGRSCRGDVQAAPGQAAGPHREPVGDAAQRRGGRGVRLGQHDRGARVAALAQPRRPAAPGPSSGTRRAEQPSTASRPPPARRRSRTPPCAVPSGSSSHDMFSTTPTIRWWVCSAIDPARSATSAAACCGVVTTSISAFGHAAGRRRSRCRRCRAAGRAAARPGRPSRRRRGTAAARGAASGRARPPASLPGGEHADRDDLHAVRLRRHDHVLDLGGPVGRRRASAAPSGRRCRRRPRRPTGRGRPARRPG